jgi:hypothetical protein
VVVRYEFSLTHTVDAGAFGALARFDRGEIALEDSMATECTAYRDSKGGLHLTPEKATLADLAGVLGRVGEEGGMTAGVAKLLFEKREEIERVFMEHDKMLAAASGTSGTGADVIPMTDAS